MSTPGAPRTLRIALACAYVLGIGTILWLVLRGPSDLVHESDREARGAVLLVLSVPFTVMGAFLVRPYLRRPALRWWVAYHIALLFIVLAYVGFFVGVGTGAPEFLGSMMLYEFPADLVGLSFPVALFVAGAPLLKRRLKMKP